MDRDKSARAPREKLAVVVIIIRILFGYLKRPFSFGSLSRT